MPIYRAIFITEIHIRDIEAKTHEDAKIEATRRFMNETEKYAKHEKRYVNIKRQRRQK